MGVDTEFYSIVGIKRNFREIEMYKSKIDSEYTNEIDLPSIVVFKDYLPDDYIVINDGMCGEYSIFGKVLTHKDYLDEIPYQEFTPNELQILIDDVYKEFKASGVEVDKSEIKLINFVHFS